MHLEKNLTIQTRRYLSQTFLDRVAIDQEKEEDRGQTVLFTLILLYQHLKFSLVSFTIELEGDYLME